MGFLPAFRLSACPACLQTAFLLLSVTSARCSVCVPQMNLACDRQRAQPQAGAGREHPPPAPSAAAFAAAVQPPPSAGRSSGARAPQLLPSSSRVKHQLSLHPAQLTWPQAPGMPPCL